jgi:hypothetical protein
MAPAFLFPLSRRRSDVADLTNDAVLEQTSQEQSAPTNGESQTDTKQVKTPKGVNLQEFEEFRKYQANQTAKERQYQQQLAQQQQALAQQQAYTAQMQAQLDAMADRDLSDYDKLQKKIERAEAREAQLLQAIQQRDYQSQQAQAKQNDLTKLATKFELTPEQYQELWKANDPDEALDKARDFRDANRAKRDQDEEERRESNRVDTGGGAASTSQKRSASSERDAWDSGDPQAWIKARLAAKKK